LSFWQELPLLLLVAIFLAVLVKTFLLQAFYVPSGSMEETLGIRDRVVVNKVVYKFRAPRRGEVIVFRGSDSWVSEGGVRSPGGLAGSVVRELGELVGLARPDERDFVKRVIGIPGDSVRCCDLRGRVTVNGQPLAESYLDEDTRDEDTPVDQEKFGPVTVPSGRLFVLGDHRSVSADSREYVKDRWFGTIPVGQVIGRAFVRVWPVSHWGWLPVPKTFGSVPVRASGVAPSPLFPWRDSPDPMITALPPDRGERRLGRSGNHGHGRA
jgi:signal peptidase I